MTSKRKPYVSSRDRRIAKARRDAILITLALAFGVPFCAILAASLALIMGDNMAGHNGKLVSAVLALFGL